jgi:uncharacterized protein (TIGR02646 family)
VYQVWRPKVKPPTVSARGGKGFELAKLQARNKAPRDVFKDYWTESDVRGCIRAACGEACAYCGDLIGRTGEDVEHFRPKATYWFLAYAFDNYLASCRTCNSSRKVNKFDLRPGAVRAINRRGLRGEQRLLLDPVRDRVEHAMNLVMVDGSYLWRTNPSAAPLLRERADYTISFFRLNEDTQLIRHRSQAVANHLVFTLEGTPAIAAIARRAASRYQPHGDAIRSIIRQSGAIQHLPSADEELSWHVEGLLDQLAKFDASLRPDRKNRDLVRWALAALAVSPPQDSTPGIVQQQIAAANALPDIEPLIALLGG